MEHPSSMQKTKPSSWGGVPAIELNRLRKSYGAVTALDGLDLRVEEGELFVLLGLNGAGKTTTLKILATLLRPTEGTASIEGHDVLREPETVKRIIGYVPDTPILYEKLSGREFLSFIADVRGVRERGRIGRFLDLFELTDVADALIETYSLGMRKKIALAAALLHRPRVLLLDEPAGGLDPQSARLMKDLLPELCSQGISVLMTTHVLETAERLCHRVGLLHRGKLIACGTVAQLKADHGESSLEDLFLKLTGVTRAALAEDLWSEG